MSPFPSVFLASTRRTTKPRVQKEETTRSLLQITSTRKTTVVLLPSFPNLPPGTGDSVTLSSKDPVEVWIPELRVSDLRVVYDLCAHPQILVGQDRNDVVMVVQLHVFDEETRVLRLTDRDR